MRAAARLRIDAGSGQPVCSTTPSSSSALRSGASDRTSNAFKLDHPTQPFVHDTQAHERQSEDSPGACAARSSQSHAFDERIKSSLANRELDGDAIRRASESSSLLRCSRLPAPVCVTKPAALPPRAAMDAPEADLPPLRSTLNAEELKQAEQEALCGRPAMGGLG